MLGLLCGTALAALAATPSPSGTAAEQAVTRGGIEHTARPCCGGIGPTSVAVDTVGNVYVAWDRYRVIRIAQDGTRTTLLDRDGDGVHPFDFPRDVAVDGRGNVYVTGGLTDNVFRITPDGAIAQILDARGDGTHPFDGADGVAVDAVGNVYVTGYSSDNVFRIAPDGTITQILDANGDGTHSLEGPADVAVDESGNVYAIGVRSNNVFQIAPTGMITHVVGDGQPTRFSLKPRSAIVIDSAGFLYVVGFVVGGSNSVVRISPEGALVRLLDRSGDGVHPATNPHRIAIDGAGNAYVTAHGSNNVFKITRGEDRVEQIMDAAGDGVHALEAPAGIAVTEGGTVYVTGSDSISLFQITPDGEITQIWPPPAAPPATESVGLVDQADGRGERYTVTQILDASGDGTHALRSPRGIAVDRDGNVYVVGLKSDNVFQIAPDGTIKQILNASGDGVHGLSIAESVATVAMVRSTSQRVARIQPIPSSSTRGRRTASLPRSLTQRAPDWVGSWVALRSSSTELKTYTSWASLATTCSGSLQAES